VRRIRHLDVRHLATNAAPLAGCSPARQRLRREALSMALTEQLVEAAYSYRVVALEAPAGPSLRAGGETFDASRLLPQTGTLTAVGALACTLGPKVEARVSRLFREKRAALAAALDELANDLLFAASRIAEDHLLAACRRDGLSVSGELRAGDPGLQLAAQPAVLQLADGAALGIALISGHFMQPLKSLAALFAVGTDLPRAQWSRCANCPAVARCRHHSSAAMAA